MLKFSHWTNWNDESVPDTWDLLDKCRNPERKFYISDRDVEEYLGRNNLDPESFEEMKKELNEENDKLPIFLDKKEADRIKNIDDEANGVIVKECVDNFIMITDSEHQAEGYKGVPVVEDENGNKYKITYSLRAWSGLMADVWNEILKTHKFGYLDFYCRGIPDEVENFLKENNMWKNT